MDQIKTGNLIRTLRRKQQMTQAELADRICVSDKTVSKWERGCGVPDISLLPLLADALCVDVEALLRGDLEENEMSNGNMKKLQFYCCPDCGNLLFATDDAEVSCCGKKLVRILPKKADESERLHAEVMDAQWYIASDHEMNREHFISFVAFLTGDTVIVKKLYPEWNLEIRLPYFAHGTLLWYCTRHGLFYQSV